MLLSFHLVRGSVWLRASNYLDRSKEWHTVPIFHSCQNKELPTSSAYFSFRTGLSCSSELNYLFSFINNSLFPLLPPFNKPGIYDYACKAELIWKPSIQRIYLKYWIYPISCYESSAVSNINIGYTLYLTMRHSFE